MFLQLWATMEANLHAAIQKAHGLDAEQGSIVCSNINLRDKLFILQTSVAIAPIYPETLRESYKKTITEIANYSNIRNMVAHDMFDVNDAETGVKFFVTKAKGKLTFPDQDWDMEKFQEAYDKIEVFITALRNMTESLGVSVLVKALAHRPTASLHPAYLSPMTAPQSLGLLAGLFQPLPVDPPLDTNIATPQKDDETTPKPED